MARLYARNLGSKQRLEQDAVHDAAEARLAAEKIELPSNTAKSADCHCIHAYFCCA